MVVRTVFTVVKVIITEGVFSTLLTSTVRHIISSRARGWNQFVLKFLSHYTIINNYPSELPILEV